MSQQMQEPPQRSHPSWRERIRQGQLSTGIPGQQTPGNTQEANEQLNEQLNELDASIDEYLSNPAAAGPSVVVGDQQQHQVERPAQASQAERTLTDERLVRGFQQTTGE